MSPQTSGDTVDFTSGGLETRWLSATETYQNLLPRTVKGALIFAEPAQISLQITLPVTLTLFFEVEVITPTGLKELVKGWREFSEVVLNRVFDSGHIHQEREGTTPFRSWGCNSNAPSGKRVKYPLAKLTPWPTISWSLKDRLGDC